MKTSRLVCSALVIFSGVGVLGQPQEAWVARYNGGFVTKSNLPVAMKIDAQGNIVVAGSGQNASGDFDYVVLKYAPDGTQLFATQHNSPGNGNDIPAALAVQGANVFVTGTAGTLKLESSGAIDWQAQLKGRDIVADEAGNSYVTGFSSNDFATAKLNTDGSTNWSRFYDVIGQTDTSHKICLDGQGNVYVAGWETTGVVQEYVYVSGVVIKYDAAGSGIWTNKYLENELGIGRTSFLGFDSTGGLAVITTIKDHYAVKISSFGGWTWITYLGSQISPLAGAGFDSNNDLCVAGGAYLAAKLASDTGKPRWEALQYPAVVNGHALGLDTVGNVYISGTFFDGNIATMQFDSSGRLRWRKDYNGPANLADRATAMAIAADNSIYVAGYSQNAQGGTDMVLIKYVETKINATPKTGGDVLLQMNGVPGSHYSFQATSDLQNWLNLTTNTADATGQATYTDTNAGNLYPFRFYRTLLVP